MGLYSEASQHTVASLGTVDFLAAGDDNPMRGKTSFHLAVNKLRRDSIPKIEIKEIHQQKSSAMVS